MSYLRRVGLALSTFIILCFSSAATARADEVAFSFDVSGVATFLSPPPLVNFQSSATGLIAPFGGGSYTASGQINFGVINPNGSSPATGTFTFTLDSGATFFGNFTEEVFPPDMFGNVAFTHVFTITGGTGIFSGASGTAFSDSGTANLGTGGIRIIGSGTISAPGLTAIPEPTTILLLGTGLAGVGAAVRQRRKAGKSEIG